MNLDDLKEQVNTDLCIDQNNLDVSSTNNPKIFTKYLDLLNKYRLLLKKEKIKYDKTYKSRWEYYQGKAPAKAYKDEPFNKKVMKSDVSIYINSDDKVLEADARVFYYSEIVSYLEEVLKYIKTRSFDIKHAIEWRRFIAGD